MRKSIPLAILLAVIANFFWAANAIVGKFVIASIPAFSLSMYRWIGALCFLLPIGFPFMRRQWRWYRAHWKQLTVLSILSVTIYNTFQYWALEYTEAITVGSLLALTPVAISIVSWGVGGRRISWWEWSTTMIAIGGALLVITDGDFSRLFNSNGGGMGLLLMIIAISSWAFYSVFIRRIPSENIHPLGVLTFTIMVGTLFIVPFWMVDIAHEGIVLPPLNLYWAIAFIAFFPSIISFICWNQAIRFSDASLAGLLVTTAPLFNALLSIVFLNASISKIQWLGISVVMLGVVATLQLSKKHLKS